MKQSLLSLLSIVFFTSLFGQSDIAPVDISISSDVANNTPVGIETGIEITVMNYGPASLLEGETIMASISYDNSLVQHAFELEVTLDSGAQTLLSFGASNTVKVLPTWDTVMFSAHVQSSADTASGNDIFSEEFYASTSINNDWNGAKITILAPGNLNNFNVDNGTNVPPPLSSISVELQNNGSVHYVEHTTIDYAIYIGNDERTLQGNIGSGGLSQGEKSLRTISNQAVLPGIPDSAGVYQLCTRVNAPQDKTDNNDASCKVFALVDLYDPTDPINWPSGTGDINASEVSIYTTNTSLHVNTEANYTLSLFDLSGKLMMQSNEIGNSELSTESMPNGLYFARLIDDNAQELASKKFVVAH